MDRSELDIIKELMAELESKMEPSKDDFEERLGRQKPGVEVMKIEGKMPGDADMPIDGGAMNESEEPGMKEMDDAMDMPMMDEEMSPEAKLKARLMKLRA